MKKFIYKFMSVCMLLTVVFMPINSANAVVNEDIYSEIMPVDTYSKQKLSKNSIPSRVAPVVYPELKPSMELFEGEVGSVLAKSVGATSVVVTYESIDTGVATVDSNGNVTAKRAGTAIINCACNSGGQLLMLSCTVNVKVNPGLYYIKNKNSGQYLTVDGGVNSENRNVLQKKFTGYSTSQLWRLEYEGGLVFSIVSQIGNGSKALYIDTSSGASANTANLVIHSDTGGSNMRFKIKRNADRTVSIATQCSDFSRVLTVYAASCDENANVFQYAYNQTMNDEWILEPFSYSATEAVKYAQANYNSHVKTYPLFNGDCTNFVSQCMLAGGFHFRDQWYIYKKNNNPNYSPPDSQISDSWELGTINDSSPWISAVEFKNFWSSRLEYQDFKGTDILNDPSIVYDAGFGDGDVVQWCRTTISGRIGNARHAMFITKKANGEYYLTYHSNNQVNKTLTSFISTSSEYENSWYRFYKVRQE